MLAHGTVDGLLHDLAHEALAELLAEQGHRHLALAEAFHLDFGLRLDQLLLHLGIEIGGGDRDGVAALQALVQGLGHLHGIILLSWSAQARMATAHMRMPRRGAR